MRKGLARGVSATPDTILAIPYTDRERVGQHCAWAGFRLLLLRDAYTLSPGQACRGVVQYLPSPLAQHYFAHGYLTIDPLLQQLSRNPTPVVWSTTAFTQEPAFWEEAHAHGVRHGWAVATHGSTRTMGILSLARSEEALTARELGNVEAQLVWLSQAAHGAITNVEMRTLHAPTERDLTLREREMLRWTAAGKTAAEIGLILGISVRTVNFHIASTLVKFNVTNKIQAVMTASMLGMLY